MPLFDEYIFVDWSSSNAPSSSRPRKDAIWIGRLLPGDSPTPTTSYERTRHAATERVERYLHDAMSVGRRVLVGFDFPYGYPKGFASIVGAGGTQAEVWSHLHAQIKDNSKNHNNRFQTAASLNTIVASAHGAGPFWGCPAAAVQPRLTSKRPFTFPLLTGRGTLLSEYRITDARFRAAGMPTLQSAWKLYGAGSVGGQALVGIPRVHQLRRHHSFESISRVWPFETGFNLESDRDRRPYVLHAEIWPGLNADRVKELIAEGRFTIRDQAQVFAICEWAAHHDNMSTLAAYFGRPIGLTADEMTTCVAEEGWILGTPR